MSQTRRAAVRRKAQLRSRLRVWLALGAVFIVAGVVAIVASSGSTHSSGSGVQQTRPVSVSGTLPPYPGAGSADSAVGMTLPTIHGQTFDGSPMTIAPDGRGKIVAVVAHWCPHCQREMPVLADYLASNPLPAGVDMVGVATDTASSRPNYPPSAWLSTIRWPTPVLADDTQGQAAQALGVTAFPYFVAVDARGKVVSRSTGELTTTAFAALVSSVATA